MSFWTRAVFERLGIEIYVDPGAFIWRDDLLGLKEPQDISDSASTVVIETAM